MRIWSIHPQYLDPQGLVALWRETLLAQAVLHGLTKGYTQHPQLVRFKAHADPQSAIGSYLRVVQAHATQRGYRFDASKILESATTITIPVTQGQLAYEWQHLRNKLEQRSPEVWERWQDVAAPQVHPLFTIVPGDVEVWEKR